jgi:hypothetical protein
VAIRIRKRADRGPDAYELRVFVGLDAHGRVRHKSRIFHGTRRAAERELARLVFEQDAKPVVVPDDTSRNWGPSTTLNDAIAGRRDNGWQDLALRWRDIDFEAGSILVDESIVAAAGGAVVKAPKTRASIRRLALDKVTMATLRSVAGRTATLAGLIGFEVSPDHFVFARELPGLQPPHPDTMSKTFAQLRERAGVDGAVHLHSLRHFQATALDTVISERQKQARLGRATVHMARHYTDGITAEDRRAAEHIGRLLAGETVRRPPKRQTPETSSA